ncbi:alpha/beta fold hydrolase [Ilumatobacter sp.]|uniref:alpha/beta fold hydrolase n=1 Tax=Ilumatobacter sp. TaxID=1967498 RepID=UPI003B52870C
MPHVAGVRHERVDLADLTVHVAHAGDPDGEPIVLVHGWPQNWYCWRHVVERLRGFRIVMPDLRGHGWTDAPRHGYEKSRLAEDLLATMDALDLDRVLLVGHDWGAWVGFLACLETPERFAGFVPTGIIHPFQRPTPSRLAQAWRGIYQIALSTPVVVPRARDPAPREAPRRTAHGAHPLDRRRP